MTKTAENIRRSDGSTNHPPHSSTDDCEGTTPWYESIPAHTGPPQLNHIPTRPPFQCTIGQDLDSTTTTLDLPTDGLRADSAQGKAQWEHMVQCPIVADHDCWSTVMLELVKHPERNSSNILRADILFDETCGSDEIQPIKVSQDSWSLQRRVIRRLLPRRPGIDAHLDQLCSFYERQEPAGTSRLVIYTPLICRTDASSLKGSIGQFLYECSSMTSAEQVPFYHPAVKALAFAYLKNESEPAGPAGTVLKSHPSVLRISSQSFGSSPSPLAIQRICTTLLKTIHAHTWGVAHSYINRIPQDRLVPKELFQDVYMNLKHRWASYLIKEWREGTNPEKHVHEDLALTAWLMCLWKVRFSDGKRLECVTIGLKERPWLQDRQQWPRPLGGFVDVGCGNGLLVWLLNNEGYPGHGFDLRPRKSWALFQTTMTIENLFRASASLGEMDEPIAVRAADLRVETLDAISFIQKQLDADPESCEDGHDASSLFPANSFLIGNHADELTPILPLLATALPSCVGMLNIPCCAWSFQGGRFNKTKYTVTREEVAELLNIPIQPLSAQPNDALQELLRSQMFELGLGPPIEAPAPRNAQGSGKGEKGARARATTSPSGSRNIAYLSYISHLHLICGWLVEKEALRIPSTKNWGIVSTLRVANASEQSKTEARERVQTLLQGVGGQWKPREREGEGEWFLELDKPSSQVAAHSSSRKSCGPHPGTRTALFTQEITTCEQDGQGQG